MFVRYLKDVQTVFSDNNNVYICLIGQLSLRKSFLKGSFRSDGYAEFNNLNNQGIYEAIYSFDKFKKRDFSKSILNEDPNFFIKNFAIGDIDNNGYVDIVISREAYYEGEEEGIYFIMNDPLAESGQ